MNIIEAVKKAKNNQKIRRPIVTIDKKIINYLVPIYKRSHKDQTNFSTNDVLADDWEIVE
jgi:hypothetical protein